LSENPVMWISTLPASVPVNQGTILYTGLAGTLSWFLVDQDESEWVEENIQFRFKTYFGEDKIVCHKDDFSLFKDYCHSVVIQGDLVTKCGKKEVRFYETQEEYEWNVIL